ncbi:cytochrome c-type biogenesis protein CcmH [Hyphomonas sp.]|uniref:cytochrome c-type biogenesis protein n=1 Tax=Hyphomonas sp. TaxID=87 RepID=UPI0035290846
MSRLFFLFCLIAIQTLSPANAQEKTESDFPPAIEAEARTVGKSLRCVVCQNQSIEDSSAPLAADMRQLVRERLAAGDTPEEVRAFMTDRYGNFVLMKPPFQPDTFILWGAPFAFVLIAALCWRLYLRPGERILDTPDPLSDEEAARLRARLQEPGDI